MTVQEWLSGLEYDKSGQEICKTSDNAIILQIRGWSKFSEYFPSRGEAGKFQDSVGQFVLEAINEKLENDKQKDLVWSKVAKNLGITIEEAKKKPLDELL